MRLSRFACAVVAVFLLGAFLLVAAAGRKGGGVEQYGGPIRAVRRLPVSEALAICDQHYRQCLAVAVADQSLCMRRREACRVQAQHTNFHRM